MSNRYKRSIVLAFSLATVGLSGCGEIDAGTWQDTSGYGVAAKQISPNLIDPTKSEAAAESSGLSKINYVASIVDDSEAKCGEFLNRLVLSETTSNTILDAATTVFTALGTAFTPIATVHALTAAGSISSGWKTTVDADVYAKANVANFAHAIQSTYYKDMSDYVTYLKNADPSKISVQLEIASIQSIHKECSLGSAEDAISAALQPSEPVATSTETISVVTPVKTGVYSITGTSASLSLTATFPAKTADTSAILTGLLSSIESQKAFQAANVTATISQSGAELLLTSPSASAVQWSTSSNLHAGPSTTTPQAQENAQFVDPVPGTFNNSKANAQ